MDRDSIGGFIDEAFIDPIRSVLIVDDDYPTYDEILKVGHLPAAAHPVGGESPGGTSQSRLQV